MRPDARERLARANPVPSSTVRPDPYLFERLVGEPRLALARTRRRSRGRLVAIVVAALIALVGTAAAVSTVVVQYFGASDSEPTPAAIVKELKRMNDAPDLPKVAAEDFVRLAAFDGTDGRITVYAAASTVGGGFCVASAVADRLEAEGCGDADKMHQPIPYAGLSGSSFGDAYVLYGRLTSKTAAVEIRFEDGTVRQAALRQPFWTYVLSGDETSPGHRPSELVARDGTRTIIASEQLFSPDFTSRGAAEARLPASDGSAAEDAMRAYLSTLARRNAGGLALEVDLARTHELQRFDTAAGPFVIYEAPAGTNGVCVAYGGASVPPPASGTFRPDSGACFRDAPTDAKPTAFANAPPAIAELDRSVYIVEGVTPPGAASIKMRYEDGSTTTIPILYHASFASWVGPPHTLAGQRPTALLAFAQDGRLLDQLELDPTHFRP